MRSPGFRRPSPAPQPGASSHQCRGVHAVGRLAACFVGLLLNLNGAEIVTSIDRTTRGWADLSMGAPSAGDAADLSLNQNPRVVFRYVPAYGKPHADAGAKELELPRLNDGQGAATGDDPANSTWFDTRGNSRIVAELQRPMDVARINVFSWHSGALSPQRYTLWASDREPAPSAEPEVFPRTG